MQYYTRLSRARREGGGGNGSCTLHVPARQAKAGFLSALTWFYFKLRVASEAAAVAYTTHSL